MGFEKSEVDHVVAIKDIYPVMLKHMANSVDDEEDLLTSGKIGISWGRSGGEAGGLLSDSYLAADGIENCIHVLDEIENGTIHNLEFVELNACNGGCVGGTLNVENPYIAKARLRSLRKYLPISRNHPHGEELPDSVMLDEFEKILDGSSTAVLSEDRVTAIAKMSEVEKIYKTLPHLDCGSCGAPNCHALAEDIVRCEANEADCLIKLRDTLGRH